MFWLNTLRLHSHSSCWCLDLLCLCSNSALALRYFVAWTDFLYLITTHSGFCETRLYGWTLKSSILVVCVTVALTWCFTPGLPAPLCLLSLLQQPRSSYSGQSCDWWRRDENIWSFTGLYSWNLHIITVHSNSLNVVAPPVHSFVSSSAGLHKNYETDFHKTWWKDETWAKKEVSPHRDVTHRFGSCHFESSIFYMLSSAILVLWKQK